ncbi:MAG: beta-galactosidase [Victivallales bacterium]|nr:beta-galactosidase [Victivallales bacterium]
MLKVNVRPVKGVPTIFINDKPSTGAMYWRGKMSAKDSKLFGDVGVNCYSINSQLWIGDAPDGSPAEYYDGFLPFPAGTPQRIDEEMELILSGNPNALVMPRFRVIAPLWWTAQHPDDMMLNYDIQSCCLRRGLLPAVDSPAWLEAAAKGLADIVRHCEEKWGDHILAYHTGMGSCAEHTYSWGASIAEYSMPHLAHFRRWLREKYGSDEALQSAWKKDKVTLDNALFPEPGRYLAYLTKGRVFLDVEHDTDMIDQQLFNSYAMAKAVTFQAKVVKDTLRQLGREKLYCTFYGYINSSSGGFGKLGHGHDGQYIVLNCPDIDIICAPINYSTRQKGGGVNSQVLPGSIALHNKIYYAEDDTGTHKAYEHHGYVPRTALEATKLLRRNFLATLSSGGNQWWMDLRGQDWYHDEQIMEEVRWQQAFAEKHIGDKASRAEIAVFVSEKTRSYDSVFPNWFMGMAIERQLNEIAAIGAPYDMFLLEDLPLLAKSGRMAQYKFAIVLNGTVIDGDLASCVKENLLADGRTVLWFYMPGYIRDGKASADFTRDITGFDLNANFGFDVKSMQTETWLDDIRITYGPLRCATPKFVCKDGEDAQRLGYYLEGTIVSTTGIGDGASLLSKRFPWGRSIWSSSTDMPSCLLIRFAQEAGVHLYSPGNPAWAGSDWIAVHAKKDGVLPVHAKGKDYAFDLKRGDNALIMLD